jgi:hypothetical protein
LNRVSSCCWLQELDGEFNHLFSRFMSLLKTKGTKKPLLEFCLTKDWNQKYGIPSWIWFIFWKLHNFTKIKNEQVITPQIKLHSI